MPETLLFEKWIKLEDQGNPGYGIYIHINEPTGEMSRVTCGKDGRLSW